ncbi:MAG TPA: phosphate ABC transporter permease, partial [Tepiditoga sp.]|nr:phosphate ABC transporter permease [Tepiditoga sp.]
MNRRILKDRFNSVLIKGLALTGIIVLIGLFIFIIKESVPALTKVGADLFTNFSWYPTYEDDPEYGLLTMIIDSGLITLLASVIVIPIGYFVAFFMYDYANKFEKGIIKSAIDSLSGVPSVVIGMFLILYVSPIFLKLNIWSGQNMLLGALGLVVLSLPYTASL